MTRPVRVAILGGGCAGIAAAEALTRRAGDRRRFAVTVYQRGHRLGGKGATGRNPRHGWRIEEHGLHVWLGFYERSFEMMRHVYAQWSPPPGAPLRTIADAFAPSYEAWLPAPAHRGTDEMWKLRLPARPGVPWDGEAGRQELSWLGAAARLALTTMHDLYRAPGPARAQAGPTLGLLRSVCRGVVRDVLPYREHGWERIDRWDLRQWLRRHGASDAVANSPIVAAFYNLAFAYPGGVRDLDAGRVAAGTALRSIMRLLLGYRGAPFWRMRAGMGDTIFAPAYQVLAERGVSFEFFHDVSQLRLDRSGQTVSRVELLRQARPRRTYDPLIEVKGQPCWPDRPRWEQLLGGEALAREGADFEHGPPRGESIDLVEGRDYDVVVLAIPVPAHPRIAAELIARSPRYRTMVESSASVATIAAQLWLRRSPDALGWGQAAPICSGDEGLFSTWADMSETLPFEDWAQAAGTPACVVYSCDVAPDPCGSPSRHAGDELERFARSWADRWTRRSTSSLTSELVHGTLRPGETAWTSQYRRLNVEASERYVLSLPGTVAHRLAPDESGFSNLLLCGDWTKTSINGGSVEAAVESGQLAAQALQQRCHTASRDDLGRKRPPTADSPHQGATWARRQAAAFRG